MKRLVAALLAFGLAGPFSSAAHQALVPHAVCAKHGELVDVVSASASSPEAGLHARADSLPGLHEHCAAAHARGAQASGASLGAARVALPLSSPPRLRPAHRAIAVLRLAPKTSPPV